MNDYQSLLDRAFELLDQMYKLHNRLIDATTLSARFNRQLSKLGRSVHELYVDLQKRGYAHCILSVTGKRWFLPDYVWDKLSKEERVRLVESVSGGKPTVPSEVTEEEYVPTSMAEIMAKLEAEGKIDKDER